MIADGRLGSNTTMRGTLPRSNSIFREKGSMYIKRPATVPFLQMRSAR